VALTDPNRRGLLGQGSILALTSVADRTSPVQRGKWIMEVLLGSPPPAPPPNVPSLDDSVSAAQGAKVLSVRERMEEHRKNPACNSCHRVIDPLGLALENFDVTGAWRIRDGDSTIDSNGDLYDGTKMQGPQGLREAILKHQDVFLLSFTESLMTYGLGRRVEHFDLPTVRAIVRDAEKADFRMSQFMLGSSRARRSRWAAPRRLRPRKSDRGAESMFITQKHISRRTALKGHGRDRGAAVPGGHGAGRHRVRQVAVEREGAAGRHRDGARLGGRHRDWRAEEPVVAGRGGLGLRPEPEQPGPLEPYRDYLTIVSNTDVRNAEAFTPPEIGGDHFRSSAVFLTQAHPKQTEGSDVRVGTSLDQLYAQKFGQDTPIPSMQLCIENVDQAGGCAYGYACVYTDTISWASADRAAADGARPARRVRQLFGVGATPEQRAARRKRRQEHPRLDHRGGRAAAKNLGPAIARGSTDYLDDVREIERASSASRPATPAASRASCRWRPMGVPDSFEEHVKLMFDLQAVAFASDITRVFSFKMGRDGSSRVYPDSGVNDRLPPGLAPRTARSASSTSPRSTSTT
jgi:hypothetical protein